MEVKSKKVVDNEVVSDPKNKSKIYFFVIAIAALLLTNVYFYVKYKSSGEKLYTVALQKENLQIEIDRIEAELDNINNQGGEEVPIDILKAEQSARATIASLRNDLENTNISDVQIQKAREQVQLLKSRVSTLKSESNELKIQNQILKRQNEELSSSVEQKSEQVRALRSDNDNLNRKVTVASSIKVSNIIVNGVERNRKGVFEIETRAKKVDNLQIKFTIADNPLAKEGEKVVYVRVVAPQGNLIAKSSDVFYSNGNKLQYTFKETIQFSNNGQEYEFLWADSERFKKGAYTILLYADNAIMGRSSVVLK